MSRGHVLIPSRVLAARDTLVPRIGQDSSPTRLFVGVEDHDLPSGQTRCVREPMRACCRQPSAVLDCNEQGRPELEGKLFTKTVLVVAVCGIGATARTLAQDETRIFQYWPIAQLVGEGLYRAEVWRRENASGKEDIAWTDPDLHGSSAEAMAAACATLLENYAFSCTQTSTDAKPGLATIESGPPKKNGSKTPPANSPIPAPKAVSAASKPGSNDWAKGFWADQSRWGHGGGGSE